MDLAAFRANAAAMTAGAAGKPIRLASKSVRCRHLIEQALGLAGDANLASAIVVMADCAEHLDLIEEAASEVQTPLLGTAADGLAFGDRVWMRHAKAGELCERFSEVHLIEGDAIVATVPTCEGQNFL